MTQVQILPPAAKFLKKLKDKKLKSLSDQIGKNLFGKFTTGIFFNGA